MATLSKGTVGLLGEIVSLLHGAVASGLRLVNNLVSSGFKMAFQFNDSAMAFSRQAGLTAKQAQAYTEVLTTRAKELGEKYGIAAEEVTKLEKNLARATGRVIMLSNAQADMQVAINRTVGEETANQFSQMMMRSMGAQYSTVQGAVSKAYALAAKSGLDAAGMAAKVGQNLAMANRLTFRNGVDGLTKMVALSEKLGFNVQTIEAAANSFMDLQDAIENSAKMTMLGGAAGAFGGNPLDMTYEANYDPEAFGERLTKTLAGYAQFDEKTGMARMNAMSRDFVKGIADAMHISLDEAATIAKKQAEIRYKNNRFGADLDILTGGDQKMKDFFINKAQFNPNTGKLEMTDRSGKAQDINYFINDKRGKEELAEMMRFNNMTDEEIVREQAESVVSIRERLEGYFTSIQALFAEKITPFIPQMQKFLGDIYKIIVPHLGQIAQNVKELLGTLFMKENIAKVKDGITAIANAVIGLGKFLTSSWKWLIGGALIGPLLGVVGWGFNQVLAFQQRNAAGASGGAGGGGWFNNFANTTKTNYQSGRTYGAGRFASARAALGSTTVGRGMVKAGGIIGAIGAGIGTIGAISSFSNREDEIRSRTDISDAKKADLIKEAARERNEDIGGAVGTGAGIGVGTWLGGIIGTMVAPGVGTAIGAAAGSAIGGWLGGAGGKALVSAVQGGEKKEKHHTGGAVGKNPSRESREVDAILRENEVVVSENNVKNIYNRVFNPTNGGNTNMAVGGNTNNKFSQTHLSVYGGNSFTNAASNGINNDHNYAYSSVVGGNNTTNVGGNSINNDRNYIYSSVAGGNTTITGDNVRNARNYVYSTAFEDNGASFMTVTNNQSESTPIAKPVGEKTVIYTPQNGQVAASTNSTLTVNDINVKFSGTLRLDGGSAHRDIDIKEILDDPTVRAYIANMVRNEFSSNTYMKEMRDTRYAMGYSDPSGIVGRMRNA